MISELRKKLFLSSLKQKTQSYENLMYKGTLDNFPLLVQFQLRHSNKLFVIIKPLAYCSLNAFRLLKFKMVSGFRYILFI